MGRDKWIILSFIINYEFSLLVVSPFAFKSESAIKQIKSEIWELRPPPAVSMNEQNDFDSQLIKKSILLS